MTARVGICGAGRISRFHANGFVKAGCTISAFADPRVDAARNVAADYGAAAFESLEAMIASGGLDIICITTPHDLHAAQAIQAFEAHLDVFMDKPIAVTPEQGRQIVETANRLGRKLGVNHNLLFHPAVIRVRELLRASAIGTPLSAVGWSTGWLVMEPHDFRLDRDRTGGGAWIDAGPHLVYVLQDLLGPIETICAVPAATKSRLGGEDTVVAVLRSESGTVANLRICYSFVAPDSDREWPQGWVQGMEINGTEGAIRFSVTPWGKVETYRRGDAGWQVIADHIDFAESFNGAIRDYIASRAAGAPPYVTATDSVQVLTLITKSLKKIRTVEASD